MVRINKLFFSDIKMHEAKIELEGGVDECITIFGDFNTPLFVTDRTNRK